LRRSLDERFDLILLDVNVTDMDVWKALNWFACCVRFRWWCSPKGRTSRRAKVLALRSSWKPLDETRFWQAARSERTASPAAEFAVARDWREYAE
jgi:hypothetical protein